MLDKICNLRNMYVQLIAYILWAFSSFSLHCINFLFLKVEMHDACPF